MEPSANLSAYTSCTLCPRHCGIDRRAGERGFCGETAQTRLAVATLHRGEEPPLTTGKGSGALFFSGCTLGCLDCQNCQLSRSQVGASVDTDELARIMLALQEAGAANINLVTGTHFAPSIIEALNRAREQGLTLPTVWNTSGFESLSTLELLDPWIDVYLSDIKTLSAESARRLTGRADYPVRVLEALPLMLAGRPLRYRGEALIRGVVVRHLVMPGGLNESLEVIRVFAGEGGEKREPVGAGALFSLMTQFIDPQMPQAGAKISKGEYNELIRALDAAGIDEGFIQEPSDDTRWLPDFEADNPFPAEFSQVLWHWKTGFSR